MSPKNVFTRILVQLEIITNRYLYLSICEQNSCLQILRDVHFVGTKTSMIDNEINNTCSQQSHVQQSQVQMFVFHVHQSSYFV
jgi:hypothetical protein